ncbi:TPA: hypothetical protein HA278_04255 [Candidatus Woesearchaeota archaeon]|nr:hypothetical protein [archaeon]HIJ11243.1 hypothetical protein [Candidatus Woesearchaeota archaeon]|tara:strand:+ start:306 stop:557 length:252 start_codon:yes stop_codon:yes gene_type:complete
MVDVDFLTTQLGELSYLTGLDFVFWVFIIPIGIEILIIMALRPVVGDNLSGLLAKKWFGILFMIVLYGICLALVSVGYSYFVS